MVKLIFQNLRPTAVVRYPRQKGLISDKTVNAPEFIGAKSLFFYSVAFDLLTIKIKPLFMLHPIQYDVTFTCMMYSLGDPVSLV